MRATIAQKDDVPGVKHLPLALLWWEMPAYSPALSASFTFNFKMIREANSTSTL